MKTIFHSKSSGHPGQGWRDQTFTRFFILAACALLFSGISAWASDPVGIYALIEKVKFEPNDEHPERIVVWGTFSVADGERGGKYTSPEKGYIYFTLPEKKSDVALKEWSDLKSVAGKNEVIGFSSRYGEPPKIRKDKEEPKNPDVFRTGFGVVRMQARRSDYPPIKSILDAAGKETPKKS
jgi:hypothetical protein